MYIHKYIYLYMTVFTKQINIPLFCFLFNPACSIKVIYYWNSLLIVNMTNYHVYLKNVESRRGVAIGIFYLFDRIPFYFWTNFWTFKCNCYWNSLANISKFHIYLKAVLNQGEEWRLGFTIYLTEYRFIFGLSILRSWYL